MYPGLTLSPRYLLDRERLALGLSREVCVCERGRARLEHVDDVEASPCGCRIIPGKRGQENGNGAEGGRKGGEEVVLEQSEPIATEMVTLGASSEPGVMRFYEIQSGLRV
ncbi:hypothetical protein HZH66_007962 [Vespula vulgaris]|uniref:Uncharacterized protein n=2 Tax=Vespula TaxID=7451 RepID=A0A834N580_VESVU|nr:hypothetical protein HZH66_007962 [Vespula vulgaris]